MPYSCGHPQYNSGRTHFKKGLIPWNKGLNYGFIKQKKETILICRSCGAEFTIKTWRLKDPSRGKFCSRDCSSKYHSGENCHYFGVSKRGKNSHNWKGGLPNCIECGKELSQRKATRCQSCNLKYHSKEKHFNWKGGVSTEAYGGEFTRKLKHLIRQRDDFTCQECEINEQELGYSLNVHHIDYNKKNNSPDNLISLCCSCHCKTNYSREQWKNYYQSIMGGN